MGRAQVRIVLEIGDNDHTWITVAPIRRSYPNRSSGVVQAIGQAAAVAIEYALADRESLAEQLALVMPDG